MFLEGQTLQSTRPVLCESRHWWFCLLFNTYCPILSVCQCPNVKYFWKAKQDYSLSNLNVKCLLKIQFMCHLLHCFINMSNVLYLMFNAFWKAKNLKVPIFNVLEHPPNQSPSFPSRAQIDLHADLRWNINIRFYFRLIMMSPVYTFLCINMKKLIIFFPRYSENSWKFCKYYRWSVS